jgi:hypothetical protein
MMVLKEKGDSYFKVQKPENDQDLKVVNTYTACKMANFALLYEKSFLLNFFIFLGFII